MNETPEKTSSLVQEKTCLDPWVHVLRNLSDPVVAIDTCQRITFWNEAAEAVYGIPSNDAVGRKLEEVYTFAWLKTEDEQAAAKALEENGWWRGENVHILRNGERLRVESLVTAVRSPGEENDGLLAIIRNVTDLRSAEAEVASLACFPSENPNPVLRSTSEGDILYANAPAQEALSAWGVSLDGTLPEDLFLAVQEAYDNAEKRQKEIQVGERTFSFTITRLAGHDHVNLYGHDITDRKRAEAKLLESHRDLEGKIAQRAAEIEQGFQRLREAEARYRALVEQIPAVTYTAGLDEASSTLYVSPQSRALLDFDMEDLLKDPDLWRKRLHPEDRERVMDSVARSHATGDPLNIEYRIVRPDRSERWVVDTARVVRDEAGRPICMQGLLFDVTERKRLQEEAAKNVQLLERIFDNTHILVAYLDRNFDFLRVNKTYADADGRSVDFFRGRNHFDLYPNEKNAAIFRKVVETGEPFFAIAKPFEYAEHPERGVTFWDWALTPVKDAQGAVEGILLTLMDVTERCRAEEELRQTQSRLTTLFEQSQTFMALLGQDGTIIELNPKAASFLEEESPLGKCIWTMKRFSSPPATANRMRDAVRRALRGEAVRETLDLLWKDELFTIVFSVHLVAGTDREDTLLVMDAVDISEERRLERAVSVLSTEERQRAGKEVHDSLGQTVTGLAFLAENLREELEQEESPLALRAERLEMEAREALEVARRLARGLAPLHRGPESLIGALQELTDHVREVYRINCRLETGQRISSGDSNIATQLYFIAREAALNAAKHAEPSEIVLRLVETQSVISLSVKDDGKGFADEPLPSGMGLSIMKARAFSVGGTFTVRSTPGKGTLILCSVVKTGDAFR